MLVERKRRGEVGEERKGGGESEKMRQGKVERERKRSLRLMKTKEIEDIKPN